MINKISSAHDDFETPFADKQLPEYANTNGPLSRRENTGLNGEFSVIQRISQFGIKNDDIIKLGINPTMISEGQYSALLLGAINKQYDTLFASVFKHWSNIPLPAEQKKQIEDVCRLYKTWGLNMILKGSDVSNKQPNMVISLEGADFIRTIEDVDVIYRNGIRSVGIQYNKPNALAETEGLTDLGKNVVTKLLDLGITVDLAHSNPKTRSDIFDLAENSGNGSLIAYTHGSTSEDIAKDERFGSLAEMRGLSKNEIMRVIKLGGIVGLGVTKPFFGSIEDIVNRIDQINQIEDGPNSVVIGADFGGVPPDFTIGISTTEEIAKIGDALSNRFGYSDEKIADILRHNLRNWVSRNIANK